MISVRGALLIWRGSPQEIAEERNKLDVSISHAGRSRSSGPEPWKVAQRHLNLISSGRLAAHSTLLTHGALEFEETPRCAVLLGWGKVDKQPAEEVLCIVPPFFLPPRPRPLHLKVTSSVAGRLANLPQHWSLARPISKNRHDACDMDTVGFTRHV